MSGHRPFKEVMEEARRKRTLRQKIRYFFQRKYIQQAEWFDAIARAYAKEQK